MFVELTGPRRKRLVTTLDVDALPGIRAFIDSCAARAGWGGDMLQRVHLASEEALVSLMGDEGSADDGPPRRLRLGVRLERGAAELEFLAASGEGNLEDRMALAAEQSVEVEAQRDFSLRLLRHLAGSVRHQKYHDTDILTVRVEARAG